MRVVVAVGGNAILRRGEPPEAELQRERALTAASELAALAKRASLVVTHGNGPQVGFLALQAEAYSGERAYPLDLLCAESDGLIGFLLDEALSTYLEGREVAAILTQVEVSPDDRAFRAPEKPIGPVYDEARASRLARDRGWTMAKDGAGWRRVVPSPEPRRIRELGVIRRLVDAGVTVVCAGGGGIPVVVTRQRWVGGVEAIIDKDATSALLAKGLGADALVLLSDVDGVYESWPSEGRAPLRRASAEDLVRRRFDPGSMGPKVTAACRFATRTGKPAYIGALGSLEAILAGESGTCVRATQAAGRRREDW
jgi:carbamate kinase